MLYMVKVRKIFVLVLGAVAALYFTGCKTENSDQQPVVSPVEFYPAAGKVLKNSVITMKSATKNAEIYYAFSPIYANDCMEKGTKGSSFEITENCKVYAFAVDSNGNVSSRTTAQYTVVSTEGYELLGTKGYLNSQSYIDSSYTVITYEENNPLYFGNPSRATSNESFERNYLVSHEPYFTLSFNNVNHISNWVGWHLASSDLGSGSRPDGEDVFYGDELLPSSFYKVQHKDYSKQNFDRGHLCPNGDRTLSDNTCYETFRTTNIVPQTANNNQKVWVKLEEYERALANSSKELYIFAGPYGQGGYNKDGILCNYIKGNSGPSYTYPLSDNGILVPASVWKIILILDEGTGDLNRVTESTKVIAVDIPNTTTCTSVATSAGYSEKDAWKYYLTTVDAIEEKTGYNFFSELSLEIQASIESTVYSD